MRVLLDTNIFIYREDDHVLSENLQELLRRLSEANAEVIIHPSSLQDLQKDIDEERKKLWVQRLEHILSRDATQSKK